MRKIPLARPLHFSDMVTVLNIDSLWLNASGLPCSPVTLIQLSGRTDHHAEPETMSGALHSLILQCFTKQQILSFFKEHSLLIYYHNPARCGCMKCNSITSLSCQYYRTGYSLKPANRKTAVFRISSSTFSSRTILSDTADTTSIPAF